MSDFGKQSLCSLGRSLFAWNMQDETISISDLEHYPWLISLRIFLNSDKVQVLVLADY